jgi:mono/diheme cytochrome c family protein
MFRPGLDEESRSSRSMNNADRGVALTTGSPWRFTTVIWALALVVGHSPAAQQPPSSTLELADYVQMPITGELNGENTRGQLARVNFLRDEPGGRRFFVSDLNGPLYILDKGPRQFTTYLDFNGLAGRPGLFAKLTFERNLATGLINVVFDPDYGRNGVFYTIHMEDPTTEAAAEPKPGVVPGLDLSGYRTTSSIAMPTQPGARITREGVMIEWTDRDISNTTFEGTARELLRMQLPSPIHPLGEMTFNPSARRGDPEWRVMYVGVGDAGTGEQRDVRRLNPQRLDNFAGKILRIVPDLREHPTTSTVSENGRYRIPNDNPFVAVAGARREIWALGLRNPHRLIWDVDPSEPRGPRLLAFNIGLAAWETVVIVKKGANYGYPLREGPQAMTPEGMAAVPADDTIPLLITDTMVRGTVKPEYPVIAYPHTAPSGGDAIAGGFLYRGSRVPGLKGRLVFADITTGRIWYTEKADLLRADDGNPTTIAPMHELSAGLRRAVEGTYRARGGLGTALPGAAAVSGPGRVDVRFAEDSAGELYLLTKSDGMIRQVVGATIVSGTLSGGSVLGKPDVTNPETRKPGNPVAPTPASIAAGRKAYDANCAACHGNLAQGAVKAGVAISIIEEQGGKQPPDLTDGQWDHGSTDGEIYAVIKRGIPPTMMAGWDGRIPDNDIWHIVNYLRSLAPPRQPGR